LYQAPSNALRQRVPAQRWPAQQDGALRSQWPAQLDPHIPARSQPLWPVTSRVPGSAQPSWRRCRWWLEPS